MLSIENIHIVEQEPPIRVLSPRLGFVPRNTLRFCRDLRREIR